MQKLLTLIIAAAILYMIFQHNVNTIRKPVIPNPTDEKLTESDNKNPTTAELSGNFVEKTLSSVLINVLKTEEGRTFLENIITPMDKPLSASGKGYKLNNENLINNMFQIKTFGEGVEGPASCGHLVTVKYTVLTLNNMVVEEKSDTFLLGSKKDVPGLDAIIVGMKTGQTRHATISAKYLDNSQKISSATFKLNVELKEIMPKNFVDGDIKIFDDEIAYHLPLLCGQQVFFDAKITKLSNGETIYDSRLAGKKINMQIGNSIYPVIFSHALHNKVPVGTRTVIAKGKLFKSYASNNSTIFPEEVLPENEYFMLDLMNFETPVANTVVNKGQ